MTFHRSVFGTYESIAPFTVEMGDKSMSQVIGWGNVVLHLSSSGVLKKCTFVDVLHVPLFAYSLVSTSTLADRGFYILFGKHSVALSKEGSIIASGSRLGGLYVLDTHQQDGVC